MEIPEKQQLDSFLDTDDVGQKRYLMNQILHQVLEDKCGDLEHEERIQQLQGSDGYLYKLSQDFLTSSSTYEKQKKLKKILDYI